MVNQDQTIPCPTCGTKIPFVVQQLLMGVQFVCPKCQGAIGLAPESKDQVKETIDKFNEMKSNVLKTPKG